MSLVSMCLVSPATDRVPTGMEKHGENLVMENGEKSHGN